MSPNSITFADQVVNTTSAGQTVTIRNVGTAALVISSVVIIGDFAQSNNCGTRIDEGASCTVTLTFTPTALGMRTGSITVTDNAAGSPHQVSLAGTGVSEPAPAVTLSPTSLAFADQFVDTTSAPRTITLTSSGTGALTISNIIAQGDFAQTNDCGTSVAAGAHCTMTVTFTPTALGMRTGSITVTDNAAGSPHQVTLAGTGVSEPAPAVTLSPTSLVFADQLVHTTSAPRTITLTNSGTGVLTISSIGVGPDFSQTNDCAASVAAGANCTISVTFTPIELGARSGSLTITDNASGSPHSVSLAGNGVNESGVVYSPAVATMMAEVTQAGLTSDINAIVALGSRDYNQPGNAAVQTYAFNRLTAAGYTPTDDTFVWSSTTLHYTVAEKTGADATDIILVLGHCDTVASSVGANDNATGCETVLRLAEIFASRSFQKTIRFLAANNEEHGGSPGTEASYIYATAHEGENITAINVDTIGLDDPANVLYVVTHSLGGQNYAAETAIHTTASQVNTAYSLGLTVTQYADSSVTNSDHRGFWANGKTAIWFLTSGGTTGGWVNSPNDTMAHVSLPFFTAAEKVVLGTVAHLAGIVDAPRGDQSSTVVDGQSSGSEFVGDVGCGDGKSSACRGLRTAQYFAAGVADRAKRWKRTRMTLAGGSS